jgi:hypothetical protein
MNPSTEREQLERDVAVLTDFFHAYCRFDQALEALKLGRGYASELRAEFDLRRKILETWKLEVEKIVTPREVSLA